MTTRTAAKTAARNVATDRSVEHGPTLAEGAGMLAELKAKLAELARLQSDVVDLVDRVMRSGTVEQLEGLPLDLVLALDHRLTRGERWMLQTAAEVLRHLPATKLLFAEGTLSWSQVRDIVGRVRRLPVDARREVDGRIAKSVELVDELDPDQLSWAVDRAVRDHEDPSKLREREAAADDDDFLWVQSDLWSDRGKVYGEFGGPSLATIVNGLDALMADTHAAARRAEGRTDGDATGDAHGPGEPDGDHHDDPEADDLEDATWRQEHAARDEARRKRDLSRRRGAALVELCARYLGGEVGSRRARPLFTVRVDLDRITDTTAGELELAVPGNPLPALSTATVEALAKTADLRAVVCDGYRPLAVSPLVDTQDVCLHTRLAVELVDGGSRGPGSRVAVRHSHLHHIRGRDGRTPHDPDGLLVLDGRWHLDRIHRKGWRIELDPHTRAATFTWRHRRHVTRVWGTPLRPLTSAERDALAHGELPTTLTAALERHRRERDRGDQLTLGSTDPPDG